MFLTCPFSSLDSERAQGKASNNLWMLRVKFPHWLKNCCRVHQFAQNQKCPSKVKELGWQYIPEKQRRPSTAAYPEDSPAPSSHRHHCLGPYNWVRQVHASQQIRPSTAKAVKRFACFWLISRTLSSDILTLLALLPPPALGAGGKFVIKKSHNTFLKKSVLSNNSDFF